MKKFFFLAALFAAVTVSAKDVVVELNQPTKVSGPGSVTPSYSNGLLTINWTAEEGWAHYGIEVSLSGLIDVTNISFEYKGDGASEYGDAGIVLYPYLRDEEGNRWYKSEYWPNAKETDWQNETFVPNIADWDNPGYEFGEKPFTFFGLVAQPSKAGSGTFYLRNVIIEATGETAIDNIASETKSVKMMKDGQIIIIRDGKTYDVLGAER